MMIQYLKNFLFSSNLKEKLLRSFLTISFISLSSLICIFILFFLLKDSIDELIFRDIPTTRVVGTLENGLNKSLADLRAWIFIGDKAYINKRKNDWQKIIIPAWKRLFQLTQKYSNHSIQKKVLLLKDYLTSLNVWQIIIENVAHTPGNYPPLNFMDTYLRPISNNIISLSTALFNA